MPVDELRPAVHALMDRAKADLAELVSFQSVADPKQYPPEECEKAAQWVVDAFAEVGLQDVTMAPTPDGSSCVHGYAPGPEGSPTVLLYCHYDVQPPLGEDLWTAPIWELTERDGRWYGRGSADCKGNIVMHLTALRALQQANGGGFPCGVKIICEGSEEQGTGGLEEFVPPNADLLRADTILVVDTGNFAVGVPTLTTTLRGMTSVDVKLTGLGSAMHSGMFGGPAPDALLGLIQMLATLHDEHGNTTVDGLDATGKWTGVDYSAEQFRSDANVLDGVELMGDGTPADLLWARPSATVIGIDVPHVLGSSAAVQASAAARVSLRLPPGVTGQDGPGRARRAPAVARAVGPALRDRARRDGRPVRGLARRARLRVAEGGDGGGLRAADGDRGAGRLDPAVQRSRRDLSRRRDLPHGRRGAEMPHPRSQRERRPVGDRAPGAGRGALPRELRAGPPMTRPFTTEDFARRLERAARQAADADLTGVLVTPGPDLLYLTGYAPIAITERITMLVVPASGGPAMIVPILERPDAESAPAAGALSLHDWTDGDDPYAATAALLEPDGRYAISDPAWAMHLLGLQHALPGSSYVSMTNALPMLRAVKGDDELERLTAAGAAADASLEEIVGVRFAGRTERDIAADLAGFLRKHGHSQVDFTVVGSGPNGANPHHEMGDRIIQEGDMVVLDFGGLKDGYGSDTTRTVHVGEPTDEEREVFEIVLRAQQAGFEAVRPGVACQEVDRAARKVIADAGYGEYFIHRTGHGIGLTTHEPPYMIEGEERLMEPGMCFSIEPGIYLPDRFGVRIEDIVTVTEDGGRRLNNTSHEMRIVA